MNPDVLAAITRLRVEGVLSAPQAALFARVARRELVSVRIELRLLLYLGVVLLTSGVGLLVAEHHDAIGPVAIAATLALAGAACIAWIARRAPAFSWGEVEPPSVAFDYVLLLGCLLLAADLAFVEAQFTVLGPRWPYHLLVVGALELLAAYRWDSRVVLGLSLTTLAAWRGVSVSLHALGARASDDLRVNAIVIGLVYVVLAALSVRLDRKAHFEPVFANLGLVLVLGALVSGVLDNRSWAAWLVALLVVAGVVVAGAFPLRRSLAFAEGVAAAYVGVLRLLFEGAPASAAFLVAALMGAGTVVLVFAAHRRMAEP
jgi:hypothetical protein